MNKIENFFQRYSFGAYILSSGHVALVSILLFTKVLPFFEKVYRGVWVYYAVIVILALYTVTVYRVYDRIPVYVNFIAGLVSWIIFFSVIYILT